MAFYMGLVRGQLHPDIVMSGYDTFPIGIWRHNSEAEEDVVTVFHCGLSNTELGTIELPTLHLCRVKMVCAHQWKMCMNCFYFLSKNSKRKNIYWLFQQLQDYVICKCAKEKFAYNRCVKAEKIIFPPFSCRFRNTN